MTHEEALKEIHEVLVWAIRTAQDAGDGEMGLVVYGLALGKIGMALEQAGYDVKGVFEG